MAARKTKKATSAASARRKYRVTHWGAKGKGGVGTFDVSSMRGVGVELGELVSITYRTTKAGDGGRADYVHKFKGPFPILAFWPDGLVIARGKSRYKVTVRGIVG